MRKLNRIAIVISAAALLLLTRMPASAQVDLNGGWQSLEHEDWIERGPGSDPVDYTGLALTDAGREKALSYTYAQLSTVERQCLYYAPHYVVWGPQGIKIWSEHDPTTGAVIAWKISAAIDRDVVTIWMDGRPHPPENVLYPFSGFTTGKWEGDVLTAYTTHIKHAYLRRNGAGSSDKATATWRFFRHGDYLTIMVIVEDPLYLAEPDVVTRTWALDPRSNMRPTPAPCIPSTEAGKPDEYGVVAHHLPNENPNVNGMTERYGLPLDAVLGKPETLYPEYRKKIKDTYKAPAQCTRYCCGWTALGDPGSAPGLSCISSGANKPYSSPPWTGFVPAPPPKQ